MTRGGMDRAVRRPCLMWLSRIERKKVFAIFSLAERQSFAQSGCRQGAVLKAPLGEDRHLQAGNRGNTARYDFPFQFIEPRHTVVRQFDKRYRLGDGDECGPQEGAETMETEVPPRSVCACVRPAKSAAVSKRMFDLSHAPSFLIQHRVIDDAANGQLRILFNGIVLQILI